MPSLVDAEFISHLRTKKCANTSKIKIIIFTALGWALRELFDRVIYVLFGD
jgi:hypothetical protein